MSVKAALLLQNWHSNVSADSVGLKPYIASLPAPFLTWGLSTWHCDKDHVEAVKKRLLSEMQDVHLATSELAAAPLEATSRSVLRSVSVPTASCASSVTPPMTPHTASATSKGGIWEDFDIQVISAQQQQSGSSDSIIEMRRYAEKKVVPRNQDPLVWWRNHEKTFPTLRKLAKKSWDHCIICSVWENFLKGRGVDQSKKKQAKGEKCQHSLVPSQKLINQFSWFFMVYTGLYISMHKWRLWHKIQAEVQLIWHSNNLKCL